MRASAGAERRGPVPAAAAVLCLAAILTGAHAQLRVQPVAEYPSDVALRLMQRKLTTVGTFMQTTAHPDDEDNVLLAQLGHGRGMRTVLVSATRGEGGQNEIGPELSEALSVLRTEEILAAHRFDGAEQFFTRAMDFGFSFSVEETFEKWGREEIVRDYVRHIRATRPHVVAGFVCGGEGGGQHHQASTALTIDAVRDAADPAKFPEQLRDGWRPWRVARLFCTQAFGTPGQTQTDLLAVDGLEFDPLIGRTYAELGTAARSMHKCQGTSQLLPLPGTEFGRMYTLLDSTDSTAAGPLKTMFDGIDTSVAGLSRFAEGDASAAATLTAIARAAAASDLAGGLRLVRELRSRLRSAGLEDAGRYEIDFRMAQKERQFEQALLLKHGVRFEAVADDGVVAEGQSVKITTIVARGGTAGLELRRLPSVAGFSEAHSSCSAAARDRSTTCVTQGDVGPSGGSMYWRSRSDAERYDFDQGVPFGVPFRPSPFRASVEIVLEGHAITIDRPIEYRYGDLVAGEKRMELEVVPGLGVVVTPPIAVIPRGNGPARAVRVTVVNNQKRPESISVKLAAPAGWRVEPPAAPLNLSREDESATVEFRVQPPAGAPEGEHALTATATSTGPVASSSQSGYQVIEYPHIRRRLIVRPATARVKVIDARIAPGLRVGYIMGVGDQVPQAIEQLGATVQLIGPDELAGGDLAKYDVIVTGVRAYERRTDLRANNHRLLSYAERGGTVLVQYNKFEFNEAQYGPFPAKVSADRVTDEHAPVVVLVPAHPVFHHPNRIGADAWRGWVQERGLYFLGDRDPRYVDLVRLTDPFPFNPGPKTGALVEARVGNGRWVYIGLGLWRQLPAGTDGAYRLLANLLSLGSRQ